jgi:hypothetical protein
VRFARPHRAPVTAELVRKQRAGEQKKKIVVNRSAEVSMKKVVG